MLILLYCSLFSIILTWFLVKMTCNGYGKSFLPFLANALLKMFPLFGHMLSKSICRSLFSTPYMNFVGLAFNQIGFLYPSKLFSALHVPLDGHIFYCNCLVYIYKWKVFSTTLLASTLIEFTFLMHQSSFRPLYAFSGPLSLLTLYRRLARSFNLCYRYIEVYIDDLIVFNNKKFSDYLKEIYPSQLTVEKANKSDHLADYLDRTFIIDSGGKLSTRLHDKYDDFDFHIVNFPFLSSNIPSGPSYGVYISQLIRYARCCSHYEDFRYRHKCLVG